MNEEKHSELYEEIRREAFSIMQTIHYENNMVSAKDVEKLAVECATYKLKYEKEKKKHDNNTTTNTTS